MNVPTRLLLACGLGLSLAAGSFAQSVQIGGGDETRVKVTKPTSSRIDRYAKWLTLDAAQTDAAKSLYAAYQAETAAAGKKFQESMKDAQEQMADGDRKEFESKMSAAMKSQSESSTKLTSSFLSDLKALLTDKQADRWPSFERLRRREQYLTGMITMGGGSPGGSNVDLYQLIDKLGLPAALKPKVDEQLAQYEVDLDRPLQEKQQNTESEQKQLGGGIQRFDMDSFTRKQERDRKVDMAIREVNTRYVRQIGAALPEEWARKLGEAYDARAYRSIYKPSSIDRKMASAQELKDLSTEQKKGLEDLLARYRRDAKAANDRWAAAQKAAEDAGRPTGGGLMVMGPGGLNGGQKIDPDIAAARDARKEVDAAAREQLEKLLSADQLAAIPQAPPAGMMGHSVQVFGDGAGADMVIAGDIDMEDMEPPIGGGPAVIIRTIESSGGDAPVIRHGAPAQGEPSGRP